MTHYAFNNAPRCGARTKGRNGEPCLCPAVRGKKRCRVHGGAKGSGAKKDNLNALKTGAHTREMKETDILCREIRKAVRKICGHATVK